jgi:hypothetical protein
MATKCEDERPSPQSGFNAQSWSGNHPHIVDCTIHSGIPGDKPVFHMVRVENLRLYTWTVTCAGTIDLDAQNVIFDDHGTERHDWHQVKKNLSSRKFDVDFDTVRFKPQISESQIINTVVTVEWDRGPAPETVTLTFEVTGHM